MKQLIVNADDFGMTPGVNEGIIRAHQQGILTSTTLMANGAAFDDAAAHARSNSKLGVGCHLVLIGGLAVADLAAIPSLAGKNGRLPETLPAFLARLCTGTLRVAEVELEISAQIAKIRSAGIEPTHLDTHKHTHAHPKVMEALARVAKTCGILRVRKPFETLRDSWSTTRLNGARASKQLLAAAATRPAAPSFEAITSRYGLRHPDYFIGLAITGRLGAAALGAIIHALPEGSTEIMLHPGICDAELLNSGSRLKQQRQTELDGLLDPAVKASVEERGVRLITFRELN